MFDSVDSALTALKKGELIIVTDDENRENEGDLVGIADYIDAEAINFMATHARGLICAPISSDIAKNAGLIPMVAHNSDEFKTAFTISIDHVSSTTGISAYERFETIKALTDKNVTTHDFNQPGHVFPLIAKDGGVRQRQGHTEAAVDLAKLSGANSVGVICEIMNEDGTMARLDDLEVYKEKHGLKMISIEDLKSYIENKTLVQHEATVNMPTAYGNFKMYGYTDGQGKEHIALVHGEIKDKMKVRIHSECLTGDVFKSARCDCGEQLDLALKIIAKEDGVILYMRQEGRGIGLANKLKAYEYIEEGYDTVAANEHLGFDADLRTYDVAAAMLKHLGLREVTLLSNNPKKIDGLRQEGIVVNREAHIVSGNEYNSSYLNTKREKLGHLL